MMNCPVKIWITLLFLSIYVVLPAQDQGVVISVDQHHRPIIRHTLAEGQTLYGVSKTYQISVDDLMEFNPNLEPDNLRIGQDIVVPIDRDRICYYREQCQSIQMMGLYYVVKPQDNLFRISRIYFNSSINQIKIINQLNLNHISPGSKILVGWIPYSDYLNSYLKPEHIDMVNKVTPAEPVIDMSTLTENTSSESPTTPPMPSTAVSTPTVSTPSSVESEEQYVAHVDSNVLWIEGEHKSEMADAGMMVTRGATAYWNKSNSSKKGKFVLHKNLPVDSMIEIYNPVTHASVVAKVVGNIPDNIYAPEIELVVTSEVANALGALDKKFYTKIRYRKY